MLFDTHVHLQDGKFSSDRAEIITKATATGVVHLIEIADSPADWNNAISLCRRWPENMNCALGLHPYYAEQLDGGFILSLESLLDNPEVVAIGEIGLDYARCRIPPSQQCYALEQLLIACRNWNKPVIIHCRNAYADMRTILKNIFPQLPPKNSFWGVLHCFSGTSEDAEFFAAAGWALGADGPITYPANNYLRQAFLKVGPHKTVLETDSPYLPPQSRRGQRNDPSSIVEIATQLASVWGLSLEDAARYTTETAYRLFRMA